MTIWDGKRIDQAISHLVEEIGPEYRVDWEQTVEKKTKMWQPISRWLEYEIEPGSQKAIITITLTKDHKQ